MSFSTILVKSQSNTLILHNNISIVTQFTKYFVITFAVFCLVTVCGLFYIVEKSHDENVEQFKSEALEAKKQELSNQVKQLINLARAQEKYNTENYRKVVSSKVNGLASSISIEIARGSISDEYENRRKVKSGIEAFLKTHPNMFGFSVDRQNNIVLPFTSATSNVNRLSNNNSNQALLDLVARKLAVTRVGDTVDATFRPDPLSNAYEVYFTQLSNTEIVVGIGVNKSDKTNQSKSQIKQQISDYSYGKDSYFWIAENGRIIAHKEPHIVGLTFDEIDNLIKTKVFTTSAQLLAKQGTLFIEYPWIKPGADVVSQKISYSAMMPEFNWMIGTGFYYKDFINEVEPKIERLNRNKNAIYANTVLVFLFVWVLFYIFVRFFTDRLATEFELFKDFLLTIKKVATSDDIARLKFVEFRQITRAINDIALERADEQNRNRINQKALALQASVFEATNEGIIITDPTGRIESVNPAFERITGYASEEVIGKPSDMLSYEKTNKYFVHRLSSELRNKGFWQGEFTNMRKNGDAYVQWTTINELRNEAGVIEHYVAVFSDVTERQALEEMARKQAIVDPLTGVDNLESAHNFLSKEWAVAIRNKQPISMILLNIDQFSAYNEHYGQIVGDECLIQISKTLIKIIQRPRDLFARMQDDQFAFILPNTDLAGSRKLAEQALEQLKQLKLRHEGSSHNGYLTLSIGIATMRPDKQTSSKMLVDNVSKAMRVARDAGGNQIASLDSK